MSTKVLFLDGETSYQVADGKKDPSPYNPKNFAVSFGFLTVPSKAHKGSASMDIMLGIDRSGVAARAIDYGFLKHSQRDTDLEFYKRFAKAVVEADVIVAHNAKFDLSWLIAMDLCVRKDVYCTMIGDYVMARGQKWKLSLDECTRRHKVSQKRGDLVEEYLHNNVSFEDIPADIVQEYGTQDIWSLFELAMAQIDYYAEHMSLVPTVQMMNEMCYTLTRIEGNGIKIDVQRLDAIEKEFKEELDAIQKRLHELTFKVMGDKPYNLSSPEQLSEIIYSRKVKDKKVWAEIFNIGTELRGAVAKPKRRPKMTKEEFVFHVRNGTEVSRKTTASQCTTCNGRGYVFKTRANGSPYARSTKCTSCSGIGIIYTLNGVAAGLRCSPTSPEDVACGGFNTDKETLRNLALSAKSEDAKEFLSLIVRSNALETYLDSFISGIRRSLRGNSTLHATFNQCVTSTGRLSCSNPNQQNLPRGNTFPVKGAYVSRWHEIGGKILEADAAQLEFRCAVFQSQDELGIKEIKEGFDVHIFTRDTITTAGQTIDRQVAKTHTFKPLYGGNSGTDAERAYYAAFTAKYEGIAKWHRQLSESAIKTKKIVLPSGREYYFPDAKRTRSGWTTFATQVKNYPVQGFATADIIPLTTIAIQNALDANPHLKSLLINEVHDSNLVDVYPGEEEAIIKLVADAMLGVVDELLRRYGVKFNVPFEIEVKIGPSWREGKVAAKFSTTKFCS